MFVQGGLQAFSVFVGSAAQRLPLGDRFGFPNMFQALLIFRFLCGEAVGLRLFKHVVECRPMCLVHGG
jgi:hypothetical protein